MACLGGMVEDGFLGLAVGSVSDKAMMAVCISGLGFYYFKAG